MHTLSKKGFELTRNGYPSKVQDPLPPPPSSLPKNVVAANGEVQTNAEAQVYVHDLDLFVTLQILDDRPAVLSLGKLFEEHVYSYEWASGQKPHLTKSSHDSDSERPKTVAPRKHRIHTHFPKDQILRGLHASQNNKASF